MVDFNGLGGGIEQACVADQGTADDLFVAAGHTLQNVSGQAFVCRVDGLPTQEEESCARTPPANAYWGLWWSDGESGSWSYSSQGAYSLNVPDGGSVALSWNDSSSASPPGAPPPDHSERPVDEPSEDPDPSQQPTNQPSQPPTSGSGGQSGSTDGAGDPTSTGGGESAAPGPGDGRQGGDGRTGPGPEDGDDESESASGDASPSDETTPLAAEPASSADDAGLPVWVGPVAVGGLLGVAGVATYLRRRTS